MDIAAWLRGLGLARYGLSRQPRRRRILPKLTRRISGRSASVWWAIAASSSKRSRRCARAPRRYLLGNDGLRYPVRPSQAERRQTVTFCDLVGSTAPVAVSPSIGAPAQSPISAAIRGRTSTTPSGEGTRFTYGSASPPGS
jgi:hypothetical protein